MGLNLISFDQITSEFFDLILTFNLILLRTFLIVRRSFLFFFSDEIKTSGALFELCKI